jgi:hypothetical protein
MRHTAAFDTLRDTAVHGPGTLDPAVRAAAHAGTATGDVGVLVDKIRADAASIEDADIDVLRGAMSEDQLLELAVCAAIGEAERRLQAARRALGRE